MDEAAKGVLHFMMVQLVELSICSGVTYHHWEYFYVECLFILTPVYYYDIMDSNIQSLSDQREDGVS